MTVTDSDTGEVLADGSAIVEPTQSADTEQLRVRGMLIGEGDISEGLSGKPTRWPGEVLAEAAESGVFEGKPLTIPDDRDPEQHVGVSKTAEGLRIDSAIALDEKIGEIESTRYESGEGLLFEGFVADAYAEDLIQRGLAQVSPVMMRSVESVDPEETGYDELYEGTQIGSVRDVGLLADGGMPSNSIEAMSGWVGEVLAQRFDESADTDTGSDIDNEPASEPEAETETENPAGDDGQTTPSNEGSGQSTPDGEGNTGSETDDDADETHRLQTQTMSDNDTDLTDDEREILRRMDHFDEPTLVEQADAEALSQADELIAAADDVDGDVEVVSKDDYEALQSHVETIDVELGEALQSQYGLKEGAVEAMSFEGKIEQFRDDEGELSLEALNQTPETGGASDDLDVFDAGDLSQEDREEIEGLAARARTFDSIDADHAEALRSQAADLAGADDFDDLEEAEVI